MNATRLSTCFASEDSDLKPVVSETLALIDIVHFGLYLPMIPIQFMDVVSPFGRYIPGDGRPDRIELSRRGPHQHLSLAHEIGHLLDHALGQYAVYSSHEPTSALAATIRTANETAAIKRMRSAAQSAHELSIDVDRRQLLYWLEPAEIWARVYAQYIAVRSDSSVMRAEIVIAQNLQPYRVYRDVQWDEDDFRPILREVDRTFGKLGWRR